MQTIPAKHLITRSKYPNAWFGTDYNMNIYRGCSHGCIYCDSRSACYQNPDFDTIKVKQDALKILHTDLRRIKKRGVIATGAMSDPYNPAESTLKLTRGALKCIAESGFGVAIATKGTLVTRDIDCLKAVIQHAPVLVKMTITTADDELARKIEPNAPPPSERFIAIKTLSEAGIFCGVLMMPLLPFINDTKANILSIVANAKRAGARFVSPSFGLTLREGNREYFYDQLDRSFSGIKAQYVKHYGNRYVCDSPNAHALWQTFHTSCDKSGLLCHNADITAAYKAPYEPPEQYRLF